MSVYKRGGVWWYSFQFEGRRIQESSGMSNKTAAMRFEARRKAELIERRSGFTRKTLPAKFEEYVETFLKWSKRQHRLRTYQLHDDNCHTLKRYFEGRWLDEITPGMVEEFKLTRIREKRQNSRDGAPISPATVNRAIRTLKLLFNHAARCGLAVSNPTMGVKFLDEGGGRMRVVSFEEELTYLQSASQPLRDIARVILDTGMRPEEVCRIEVANIDFMQRTIFNPHGKTRAARRTVPITDEVWLILRSRAAAARGPYVFPSERDSNTPIGCVRKAHDGAVNRAHMTERFRLYDLRHTYATRTVAAGVDLPTLAALLGHTKITMTMRYVHPAEEQKRLAVAKLEKFKNMGMQKLSEEIMGSLQNPLQ
jgi:integrase